MDGVVPHDDYGFGAGFLWRWVDLPQDKAMASFVSRATVADEEARDEFRAALSVDDAYTLLLSCRKTAISTHTAARAVIMGGNWLW